MRKITSEVKTFYMSAANVKIFKLVPSSDFHHAHVQKTLTVVHRKRDQNHEIRFEPFGRAFQ